MMIMVGSWTMNKAGPNLTLVGKQLPVSAAALETCPPVLVVDDHELVSESLTIALRSRGIPATSCTVTDAEGVLVCAAAMQPGVVLLDVELGRDSGGDPIDSAELTGALHADGWAVVAVTGHPESESNRIAAAVAFGAAAILSKSIPLRELLRVVAEVAAGNSIISYQERRQWLNQHRHLQAHIRRRTDRVNRLTPREREVLSLLAVGQHAAAIADAFVVSLATVRSQIRSILKKLEVRSQLEAVALVRQDRLINQVNTRVGRESPDAPDQRGQPGDVGRYR